MGLSKLNVWLTETDNLCEINDWTFYVSIFTCDGEILKWAGKEFKLLEALDFHLEIKIPPGCYYFRSASIHCENAYSDSAIVRATCEETVCVTLLLTSLRGCIATLNVALRLPANIERIPREMVRPMQDALNRITNRLPTPARSFELHNVKEMEDFILRPPKTVEKA